MPSSSPSGKELGVCMGGTTCVRTCSFFWRHAHTMLQSSIQPSSQPYKLQAWDYQVPRTRKASEQCCLLKSTPGCLAGTVPREAPTRVARVREHIARMLRALALCARAARHRSEYREQHLRRFQRRENLKAGSKREHHHTRSSDLLVGHRQQTLSTCGARQTGGPDQHAAAVHVHVFATVCERFLAAAGASDQVRRGLHVRLGRRFVDNEHLQPTAMHEHSFCSGQRTLGSLCVCVCDQCEHTSRVPLS